MPDPSQYIHIIHILTTVLLLICSAMISGSEVAVFSLTQLDLDDIQEQGSKNGKLLIKLLKDPKNLLANILVANNAINILIVLLSATIYDFYFQDFTNAIHLLGWEVGIRYLIEIPLITFLLLLFGEVLPKVYANRNAKKFALTMIPYLNMIRKLFFIFSKPLTGLSNVIEKRLRNSKSNFSVEDLSQALELTSEDETTTEQKNILKGIVNFGNTETVQIMIPRTDIDAISKNSSFTDVLDTISKNGHSRTPVYDSNIDEVVGVLFTKDLLPYLNKKTFNWFLLIKEPLFVPENKKLDDLLTDFQEKKNHLAIVVDEYGGTSGLVTMQDVIEEIVGDISDEFDDIDLSYSKIDDKTYVFDGKINIKDFCKVLHLNESIFEKDKGESETLAGLILEISGKFPRKFEKINYTHFTFTIEAIDKRRIKQVKMTINS